MTINIAPDTVQGQGTKTSAFNYTDDGNPTHDIEGYPAVNGGKNDLRCGTFVGTSKTYVVSVDFTVGTEGRGDPECSDPCAMSDKIAGMVLDNLPTR